MSQAGALASVKATPKSVAPSRAKPRAKASNSSTDSGVLGVKPGFHQKASRDYLKSLMKGVTQALDQRDGAFGDYRTQRDSGGEK